MPLKTGDNALGKHLPSTEKKERIVTATINFLSGERDFCSLCIMAVLVAKLIFNYSLWNIFLLWFCSRTVP